ncbi:hypothetical protein [Aquibacillus salsiterrae]|uniref:Uncharacterized protein n=1 Tax=Aquibacillus salsiterrae TaxID=2950439 RepID=A0A9X3WCF2_9BACI|nr:hypothetical protein [Aquibacillus salsiterrae]MDC3416308.1 hypothetical protein [Aquibacillus salsiterrae]
MQEDRVNEEVTAHPDGKREGIISDSIGKEIGIRNDASSSSKNPFHVKSLKKDEGMKRFDNSLK